MSLAHVDAKRLSRSDVGFASAIGPPSSHTMLVKYLCFPTLLRSIQIKRSPTL